MVLSDFSKTLMQCDVAALFSAVITLDDYKNYCFMGGGLIKIYEYLLLLNSSESVKC